jgi:hypothetical protein
MKDKYMFVNIELKISYYSVEFLNIIHIIKTIKQNYSEVINNPLNRYRVV